MQWQLQQLGWGGADVSTFPVIGMKLTIALFSAGALEYSLKMTRAWSAIRKKFEISRVFHSITVDWIIIRGEGVIFPVI